MSRRTYVGIDASTTSTGLAVIMFDDQEIIHATAEFFLCPKSGVSWQERCVSIASQVGAALAADWRVKHLVAIGMESPFGSLNQSVPAKLGFARGAIAYALHAEKLPLPTDIAPREARRIVVGDGAATKQHVGDCLRRMTSAASTKQVYWDSDDATDALCIAMAMRMSKETRK